MQCLSQTSLLWFDLSKVHICKFCGHSDAPVYVCLFHSLSACHRLALELGQLGSLSGSLSAFNLCIILLAVERWTSDFLFLNSVINSPRLIYSSSYVSKVTIAQYDNLEASLQNCNCKRTGWIKHIVWYCILVSNIHAIHIHIFGPSNLLELSPVDETQKLMRAVVITCTAKEIKVIKKIWTNNIAIAVCS